MLFIVRALTRALTFEARCFFSTPHSHQVILMSLMLAHPTFMNRAPGKRGIHKHLLSEAAQLLIIVHERRYRDAHAMKPHSSLFGACVTSTRKPQRPCLNHQDEGALAAFFDPNLGTIFNVRSASEPTCGNMRRQCRQTCHPQFINFFTSQPLVTQPRKPVQGLKGHRHIHQNLHPPNLINFSSTFHRVFVSVCSKNTWMSELIR